MPRKDKTIQLESLFDKFGAPHLRAMANYIPPKIDCEVIAISCEQHANTFEWSTEPWVQLARNVHRTIVPGQHTTCITTYVEALAQILNEATAK